jgi:hypothetical protein
MLMSLIIIHPLKSNMWHYEDFWTYKLFSFWNINLHHPLWLLMMVWDYNMWHNKRNSHHILIIYILKHISTLVPK